MNFFSSSVGGQLDKVCSTIAYVDWRDIWVAIAKGRK